MLNKLPKITNNKQKRLGRGTGSGVGGHTVGRGNKGHTARQGGATPMWFEGGQLPLIKRLPYWRGKFHFKSLEDKPITLSVDKLAKLTGQDVTPETLVSVGLIKHVHIPVKVVAGGEVPRVQSVRGVRATASVRKALEEKGAKFE